jgi:uncharacterized protein YdcH (DUF465 family)
MKKIDVASLSKKINQLNKKIHRAEKQRNDNKAWWRKMKLAKLKNKLEKSMPENGVVVDITPLK